MSGKQDGKNFPVRIRQKIGVKKSLRGQAKKVGAGIISHRAECAAYINITEAVFYHTIHFAVHQWKRGHHITEVFIHRNKMAGAGRYLRKASAYIKQAVAQQKCFYGAVRNPKGSVACLCDGILSL